MTHKELEQWHNPMSNPEIFNQVNPISFACLYPGGIVLIRDCLLQGQRPRGDRRKVAMFSRGSYARLAFLVANITLEFKSLITLTYPLDYPTDGQVFKEHLRRILIYLGRKFGHFSYLWFMEFQRRGAPHFHILTTLPPPGEERLSMLAYYWVELQGLQNWAYQRIKDRKLFHVKQSALSVALHESTWQAIRKPQGGKRYALKYALKPYQKQPASFLRNIGRFWGCSSDLKPGMPKHIVSASEEDMREFLYNHGHQAHNWDVLPKYLISFDKW